MDSKSKNILLIIGFFLGLLICYHLAICKTVSLKKEYASLQRQKLLFENTPKQLSILKQKQKYYDSTLIANELDGSSIQNNLLKTINSFSNQDNLKVLSFLEPHAYTQNNLTIKTYEFIVQGSYNTIIALVHKLEQETRFGEVINLHFEKETNFRTNKRFLKAAILIQHYAQ